jgi:hypothetical protein
MAVVGSSVLVDDVPTISEILSSTCRLASRSIMTPIIDMVLSSSMLVVAADIVLARYRCANPSTIAIPGRMFLIMSSSTTCSRLTDKQAQRSCINSSVPAPWKNKREKGLSNDIEGHHRKQPQSPEELYYLPR